MSGSDDRSMCFLSSQLSFFQVRLYWQVFTPENPHFLPYTLCTTLGLHLWYTWLFGLCLVFRVFRKDFNQVLFIFRSFSCSNRLYGTWVGYAFISSKEKPYHSHHAGGTERHFCFRKKYTNTKAYCRSWPYRKIPKAMEGLFSPKSLHCLPVLSGRKIPSACI